MFIRLSSADDIMPNGTRLFSEQEGISQSDHLRLMVSHRVPDAEGTSHIECEVSISLNGDAWGIVKRTGFPPWPSSGCYIIRFPSSCTLSTPECETLHALLT